MAGLRYLNFYISLAIAASVVNGYDSSVLNGMNLHEAWISSTDSGFPLPGLQILPQFQEHFNHPNGSTLGFMSAAQTFGSLLVCAQALAFSPRHDIVSSSSQLLLTSPMALVVGRHSPSGASLSQVV
jgi:hypothetical protein